MRQNNYSYFFRDLSWLSFNKRVMMEAESPEVPLYERINFLSIFSSNLEEFYRVRVADLRSALSKGHSRDYTKEEAHHILNSITTEVIRQEKDLRRTFAHICEELKQHGVILYTDCKDFDAHTKRFSKKYFRDEVFPFLYPTPLSDSIRVFLRDSRLYLCVSVIHQESGEKSHYLIKVPYKKVKRIITVPNSKPGIYTYALVEEIIRDNLSEIFTGYEVISSRCIRISRDAEIYTKETYGTELAESIESYLSKRKTGSIARMMYDESLPQEVLEILFHAFDLSDEDLLPCGRVLQISDMRQLPNPLGPRFKRIYPDPIPVFSPTDTPSLIDRILEGDIAIHMPYNSFDNFMRLLDEARTDERVTDVMITQYRVADDSKVIEKLIQIADAGKRVTVFVELKARFDEENNLMTARQMTRHGVNILYSLPRLKVHAKTALLLFDPSRVYITPGIACFSTGNFNESTSVIYSDIIMMTADKELTLELSWLFNYLLHPEVRPTFRHLMVAGFNMVDGLESLVRYEIDEAQAGRPARICLKLNALQDIDMINLLYQASEAGVKEDLIIRGICCLIPNQSFSQNITVTRIVDMYLEHSRIWYFYHSGEELLYIASADWMRRNLHHRIECAAPVKHPDIRSFILETLEANLAGNVKACFIDEYLENIPKANESDTTIRLQSEMYNVVSKYVSKL